MMVTMNRAVFEGAGVLREHMSSLFDRPTSWVLNSIRYTKATRSNLVAKIDLDRWGNKQAVSVAQVLKAQINGGNRNLKRSEVALSRIGVLPSGMYVVPGSGAQMDKNGNMAASQIVQILSWFRAFGEQGYSANMKDAGRDRLGRGSKKKGRYGFAYFALQKPHGKLRPGIYQRFKTQFGYAVKPVMLFVRTPTYKKRFDFYRTGNEAVMHVLNRDLEREVSNAIRTAR